MQTKPKDCSDILRKSLAKLTPRRITQKIIKLSVILSSAKVVWILYEPAQRPT